MALNVPEVTFSVPDLTNRAVSNKLNRARVVFSCAVKLLVELGTICLLFGHFSNTPTPFAAFDGAVLARSEPSVPVVLLVVNFTVTLRVLVQFPVTATPAFMVLSFSISDTP